MSEPATTNAPAMSEQEQRAALVREALTWERTPFAWGQCVKGLGADCGRFVAGALAGAGVKQINLAALPQIPQGWFLHTATGAASPFVAEILRYAAEYELTPGRRPLAGDIVVAKLGRDWAHSAIVIEWPKVIGCASGFCVTVWRDIHRSPQFGSRALRFFDPFAPAAGTGK